MTRTIPTPADGPIVSVPGTGTGQDLGPFLNQGLRQALVPVPLPTTFRTQLMATVHLEGLQSLAQRRQELEREHAQALQQLHSGHVRLQRDTLALVVAAAFTAGTCANLALPWLNDALGASAAAVMPLVAVLIGVATGASVWWDRLGRRL